MLGRDVDIGVPARQVHVAPARNDGDLRFARQGNIEIGCDGVFSRRVGLGIERHQAADGGEGGLGLVVVLVGVVLIVGTHALADDDRDFVVVGGVYADCAVSVEYFEAGSRGGILLEVGVV